MIELIGPIAGLIPSGSCSSTWEIRSATCCRAR